MQLVFDTNVLVDALLSRGHYYKHTLELLEAVKEEKIEGWVASHSISTIFYLLESTLQQDIHNRKEVQEIVSKLIYELLDIIKVIPQTAHDIKISLKEFESDYEDYVIAKIAQNYLPNPIIVSRDKRFDGAVNIDVEHPVDVKRLLENQSRQKIDFANLAKQQRKIIPEIEKNIHRVITKCNFIMGDEITQLEQKLQDFTGAKYAITCASGTDALLLAMMAMDIQPDDEIITTPFTFIATAETIALMKAKPVFVDIEDDTYNIDATKIEAAITHKTKAIMPVSLYGQPADMDAIQAIAYKHKLKVIIDGAQSFGSTYKGKTDSNLGDISTTSFFPAKPLGCYGDGGAVFTNNDEYAEKMRMMRVHGQNKRYHHKYIGMGGRLDTIQAAILLAKLTNYPEEIKQRQAVATTYSEKLDSSVINPITKEERSSVWAQYSIRVKDRDQVQNKLKEAGIPTAVHYPMPLHLQECFQYLDYKEGGFPVAESVSNEIMSLPMNPFLTEKEINAIVLSIHA